MKSEAAVQREVVRYLKALGAKVWRVGQYRAQRTQDAGVSDLIVFYRTRLLFLEVKSKTGRQREEQREFAYACQGVGARIHQPTVDYAVVRSLADVDRVLGNTGRETGNA